MIRFWILIALGAASLAARAAPLSTLAEVRALAANEAARGLPVRVEATVLGTDPASRWNLFIHDGTAGCYVNLLPRTDPPPHFTPGMRVRIEGISLPLGYYPSIGRATAEVLGQGELPAPVRLLAEKVYAPELDSAWVEVPAVVVGYEARDQRMTLDVDVYGLSLKAELPMGQRAEEQAAALMQRPVLLRGVLGTIFNRQRQMTDRHFFVSSFDAITPAPLPAGGGAAPLATVTQLLSGGFGPQTQVRVRGVVTQIDPRGFFLRDATGATRVFAAQHGRFPPGTEVEVAGFGGVAPFRPVLRAARVDERGRSAPPPPVPFKTERGDWPALHADLVTLEAVYLTRQDGRADAILECQAGSQIFEALLPLAGAKTLQLNTGDRVRLTGICELTTTHGLPRIGWVDGFRLHLPGVQGVVLVDRAPWWTAQRLGVALGLTSALAALGLAGVWILRRQVRRQLAVIGSQLRNEAVARERDRMARDLHDTLEQQLSGVALQLDGVDDAVKTDPGAATRALALARRMLRHTRLEARRSVWDLRSRVLEQQGLVAALRAMAEASGGPASPRIDITGSDSPHLLPAAVEFHLFRIAQEALANALKHGGARAITIDFTHTPLGSRLTVHDNGRGFDPPAADGAPGLHFGLLGMRERAAKIGAELTIAAAPDKGCTITVHVPGPTPPSPQ